MKNLILIFLLFALLSCKKTPGYEISQPQITITQSLKLGDLVRWISPKNPTPNNKMVIKAVYYNDPNQPLTITVLDGSIYYTDNASQFILWK